MSATLEAPATDRGALLLPEDEKGMWSNIPSARLDGLPLVTGGQPALSAFDRLARDFPHLFILASA